MSSYEGTWSRSNRESGAVVDVGAAVFDSKRTVEGTGARNGAGAGRRTVNVCRVCRKRFADAGMRAVETFSLVPGTALRANARSKDGEERMAAVWAWSLR